MTYYINPIWFYIMDVSEGLKTFLIILAVMASICCFIGAIVLAASNLEPISDWDEEQKRPFKFMKKVAIASVIALFIGSFIPSKETCVTMMVASQVTHENVAATKEEIYELIDYVTDKVRDEE